MKKMYIKKTSKKKYYEFNAVKVKSHLKIVLAFDLKTMISKNAGS